MDDNITAKTTFSMSPADIFRFRRYFMATMQQHLYYRDQTPASAQSLRDLASAFRPSLIVELGTLSGLSLRIWLAAAPQAAVKAIDLDFSPLRRSATCFPLDWSKIDLIQTNILKLNFSSLWSERDRVLLFVDAHDLPDTPIMAHVLKNAIPLLPLGSLVVVDDVWHSPEPIDATNSRRLFKEHVLPQIDELLCFDAHYAPYHGGGSFFGFPEVAPLLRYVNRHGIRLEFTPGVKHVAFRVEDAPPSAAPEYDKQDFTARCGVVRWHPLQGTVRGSALAEKVMPGVMQLYERGDNHAVLKLLLDLREKDPQAEGTGYALGVALAAARQFSLAVDALRADLASADPHPNAARLEADIRAAFLRHRAPDKPRRPGVTLFSMPKPFKGHNGLIQRNAIASWLALRPRPEIILLGDEGGTAEICATYGLRHIPDVRRNDFGTPLVDDIFYKAQEAADRQILCYINADIIIFDDLLRAIEIAAKKFDSFLLVGRRIDFDLARELDFADPDQVSSILEEALSGGVLHEPYAMDYFAFRPGLWENIPPFALGRLYWDSWLLSDCLERRRAVVDGSGFVDVLHQNHDYAHLPSGLDVRALYAGRDPEVKRNLALAGAMSGGTRVYDAPFALHKNGYIVARKKVDPHS
ncbi:MAG: hypothetical protein LBB66_10720 [Desulfovibrio sp.]|jgi:predicted O-methyltransferase YrrM|nr:hypothetical protein [Desulfovibrio sp.]